jgi:hypothetical protein
MWAWTHSSQPNTSSATAKLYLLSMLILLTMYGFIADVHGDANEELIPPLFQGRNLVHMPGLQWNAFALEPGRVGPERRAGCSGANGLYPGNPR